jgi:hypothetical protein
MKNPPQPEGYTNYHQKVDLDEMFDSIEEKEQVFYPMYQKITKTLFDLHDYHVYFTMTSSVIGQGIDLGRMPNSTSIVAGVKIKL